MSGAMSEPDMVVDAASPAVPPDSGEQRSRDPLRQQRAVVAMGRGAVNTPDADALLRDAAALLMETLDTQYGVLARCSPQGDALRVQVLPAAAKDPDASARVHHCSATGNQSLGAFVLKSAGPVVVNDLCEEKRFTDDFLFQQGVRSAVAAPLVLRERGLGILAACSTQRRDFREEDVLFVESIASLVGATVAQRQAEKTLEEERRLIGNLLETVDAMVLVLDLRTRITSANSACQRISGFEVEEIKDRPIASVFLTAEEEGLLARLPEKVRGSSAPWRVETALLTKHSQRRRVAWSFREATDGTGSPQSIIATAVDVTERREAEEQAQRAQEAADQAQQTLAQFMEDETANQEQSGARAISSPQGGGESAQEDRSGDAFSPLAAPFHTERRRRPRRSFPYRQLVAPVIDGELPDKQDFQEVQCSDIAASGFSFLTERPPESDVIVVALGIPPNVTHLAAEVVHITRITTGGKRTFLVGCRYVGRAEY